jgi:lipoprotein-releasing system permease protein
MLPVEGQIAFRYLSASRKNGFLAIMNVVSMIGVAVGVFAQIGALALMTGLQGDLRQRLLRGTTAVVVKLPTAVDRAERDAAMTKLSALPHVAAAAPVVRGIGLLSSGSANAGVEIRGIDPAREKQVTEFLSRLEHGSEQLMTPGSVPWVAVGVDLAKQLDLRVGDPAELLVTLDAAQFLSGGASRQTVRVAGIFSLGLSMFDQAQILIPIDTAQTLLKERGVTSVQLRLDQPDAAPDVARAAKAVLPQSEPTEWTVTNRSLFGALQLEKVAMVASVGLIVAISALNILSALALLIAKKQKDIAILRTMGATPGTIARVFLGYAFVMALVGSICGMLASFATGWVINKYKLISLTDANEIPYIRFEFSVTATLAMIGLAVGLCLLATWYPARSASRILPVDALRE